MTLSEEILKQIKDMSAALLPPAEIAILLDIPTDQRDYFCDICKNHCSSPYIPPIIRGDFRPSSISGKQLSNWPLLAVLPPNLLLINT